MVLNKSHQNCERVPIENTQPNHKIRLVDPDVGMDPTQSNICRREDRFLEYDQVNGFFKGLFIMLPCSILLWGIVVWGVRSLIY
jgi:hypothetical protein